MKIIGLGRAGCNLAAAFGKFPQYDTYGIDAHKEADVTIKERETHEEYEKHFPSLKRKFKFTNEEIIFIIGGSGRISGATLRLLEPFREGNKIFVLYVQPDLALLSETQKKQEKIVKNILQEYARSGMIECVYLVDNLMVEKGIGDVPIRGVF